MILCSIGGLPLSAKIAMAAYHLMMNRMTAIAKSFQGFENLPLNYQTILRKRNTDLIISLQGAAFFQRQKQGVIQILISLDTEDQEIARDILAEEHISSSPQYGHFNGLNYKNVNNLQEKLDNLPSEIKYDPLLSKIGATIISDQHLFRLLSYIFYIFLR